MYHVPKSVLLGAGMSLLSACTAVENQRGYVPDAEIVQTVAVGTDTKATVTQKLGTPTSRGTFDDNTWYYISSFDTQTAFLRPQAQERSIVEMKFSEDGQLADIRQYGLDDARVVSFADGETPTSGSELTLLQQILGAVPGNIGQMNRNIPDQNPGGGGGPPP